MRKLVLTAIVLGFMVSASIVQAQATRTDAIWARSVPPGTITLDGKLNEAAWATADSIHIYYGQNSGLPGSGWHNENTNEPTDPTHATVKFLVCNDTLYVGARVPDSSIGGGLFNQFDGFLINLMDISSGHAGSHEYFYGWVTETWADTNTGKVGAMPNKIGGSASDSANGQPTWRAAAYIMGTTNTDTTSTGAFSPDTGYSVEFAFNLAARGYDLTNAKKSVVLYSMSIYDADWEWPFNADKFSGTRAWIQNPWSNASWYNMLKVYTSPNVTLSSGTEPAIAPDYVVPNGADFAAPTIDGNLNDSVWANVKGFKIAYGDSALRAGYPNAGAYLSGQYQATINSLTPPVLDPDSVMVKMFFKADTLYMSADVSDQVVTHVNNYDQWDGIRLTLNDRTAIDSVDHEKASYDIAIRVDSLGHALLDGDAPLLDSLGVIRAKLMLKPGTQVNDVNNIGTGYTVEVAVDLTKIGYADGLGDGTLWAGMTHFDGDVYSDPTENTGARMWWYRETKTSSGPAWAYMDKASLVTGVEEQNPPALPKKFVLVGNYPNPFNPSTRISFSMPEAARVTLTVYNILGQLVRSVDLGVQSPGNRYVTFDGSRLSSGVYFYQLHMRTASGHTQSTAAGKMLLLK